MDFSRVGFYIRASSHNLTRIHGHSLQRGKHQRDVLQDPMLMVAFGFSLGAFLIGGFVIGWMSEEVRVLDSLFVTVATMALISLVYAALPHVSKGQFVSGYFLSEIKRGSVFASLSLIGAAIGAYWGWHVTVPQEGVLDRVALLIGLLVIGHRAVRVTGDKRERPQQSE